MGSAQDYGRQARPSDVWIQGKGTCVVCLHALWLLPASEDVQGQGRQRPGRRVKAITRFQSDQDTALCVHMMWLPPASGSVQGPSRRVKMRGNRCNRVIGAALGGRQHVIASLLSGHSGHSCGWGGLGSCNDSWA